MSYRARFDDTQESFLRVDITRESFSEIERKLHEARYLFAERLDLGSRVLDCACGTGYGSQILSRPGNRFVLGVDVSEKVVSEARQRYGSEWVEFRAADAHHLEQLPGPFSAVVSFGTLELMQDPDRVLRNFATLLEPGGTLVISGENASITAPIRRLPPAHPFMLWEDSISEFTWRLQRAGFTIRESYGQAHLSRNMRLLYRAARGRGQLLAHGPVSRLEAQILRLERALIRRFQYKVVKGSDDAEPSAEYPLDTYVYHLHVCERIGSSPSG